MSSGGIHKLPKAGEIWKSKDHRTHVHLFIVSVTEDNTYANIYYVTVYPIPGDSSHQLLMPHDTLIRRYRKFQ